MHKIPRIIIALVLLTALVAGILEINIISFAVSAKPQKADCIIILGCKVNGSVPSAFLAARVDEGVRLYQKGYGKFIIVSGSKGPGEEIAEAQCMKKMLLSKGVPPDNIIMEDSSHSTAENIRNSYSVMVNRNLRTACIVSNSFHLKRISYIAANDGVQASFAGVFVKRYFNGYLREIPALVKGYLSTHHRY